MNQRGFTMLIQLAIYAALAAAVVASILGAYAYVKHIGYNEAEAEYKPKVAKAEGERDVCKATYDRFAADVDRLGKEQAAITAQLNDKNEKLAAERKADYDKRMARVFVDTELRIARVRSQYASARTDSSPVRVPEVSVIAGASECRSTDAVLDLQRQVEGLSTDCAVTTSLFLECRDSWKGIVR